MSDLLEAALREKPLGGLAIEINHINRANGWKVLKPEDWTDEPYKVPAVLMLIVSEAAEALEGFRHDDRANFDEEIADILIRVLDLAGGLGIDIDHEVGVKLEKNRHRGERHGGKRI